MLSNQWQTIFQIGDKLFDQISDKTCTKTVVKRHVPPPSWNTLDIQSYQSDLHF